MFKKFKKGTEIQRPTIVTDPHVTSPGQVEPVIVRNNLKVNRVDTTIELYERARHIYDRARRSGRRRAAGII